MPSTLALVQLAAVALLLVSAAETFRPRPWWPRPPGRSGDRPPPRGSSPRERRWLHAGLALLLGGNVIGMELPDDEVAMTGSAVLLLGGLVLVAVGLVRGPSEPELARYDAEVRPARAEDAGEGQRSSREDASDHDGGAPDVDGDDRPGA